MPRMTALQRLNKRGIVAWEVDGVLARFTKTQSAKADLVAQRRPFVQLVAEFAAHIRERVQQRGDLAGQSTPAPSQRTILLSPSYAAAAGVPVKGKFASVRGTDALHAAAGHDFRTLTVTGGMWRGLQARATGGGSNVIVDFQGSSEGRGFASFGFRKRDGKVRKVVKAVAKQPARNQWKAVAIFAKLGVHPLLHRDAEMLALAESVVAPFARGSAMVFGEKTNLAAGWLGGDTTLAQRLAAV